MDVWDAPPTVVAVTTACLLLAAIFVLKYYFWTLYPNRRTSSPVLYGTTASSSSFSLANASHSFQLYPSLIESEANAYRSKLNSLRGAHRRLAVEIGYPAKIERMRGAGIANSRITTAIYNLARDEFPNLGMSRMAMTGNNTMKPDIGRVRESLKHMVRDWSSEGANERDVVFSPILAELRKIPAERRPEHRVLVPGAGLGRLAWEIANMGQ